MQPDHMRHLPDLMRDIIALDDRIMRLRGPKDLAEARQLREWRAERDKLRDAAHRVYGHTPARGDRGPSTAGAVAA